MDPNKKDISAGIILAHMSHEPPCFIHYDEIGPGLKRFNEDIHHNKFNEGWNVIKHYVTLSKRNKIIN